MKNPQVLFIHKHFTEKYHALRKEHKMKKTLSITSLIALCLILLSTGIVNVSASGGPTVIPTPVGVPIKQPEAQEAQMVVGVPQGFPLSKETMQISAMGSPHEGFSGSKQSEFATASGGVTVTSVWTTDGNGNGKSTFNQGDSINWYGYVYNTTGSSQTAYFVWSLNGPCGSSTLWSGNLSTAAGQPWWDLSGSIPSNACAGTYTYTLSVTFNGSASSKSTTYHVNGSSGSVTITSAWTTDGNGNGKSTFNPGDSIRWNGNVNNTTGSSQTAYFVWSLNGPCGSNTLWSGNLSTGTWTWYLSGSIPSNACAGTYTYTLSVTFNGSASSKSTTYTVIVNNVPRYNQTFLTDAQLQDYASMNATQIQQFLTSKGSYYRQTVVDADGVSFNASNVIAQAATVYQISPKVILATLQKESSVVTSGKTGYMPDLMGCGTSVKLPVPLNTARGQLWCAAERYRTYQNELNSSGVTLSGWKVGVPMKTQDCVTVTPATKAVAGQFTYNPYAGVGWGGCKPGVGGIYLFDYVYHGQFGW
jgi:archaellum component FlaG (FlaF/FlaG flagellin family)